MARCEDCIHDKVCNMWAIDSGIPFVNAITCEHYTTADIVPKSEVEEWVSKCRDWHEVAELKSKRIVELEAELSKAKAEVAREIFEEIEKFGKKPCQEAMTTYVIFQSKLDELKKKYTEGASE